MSNCPVGDSITCCISALKESSYPEAWPGYTVAATYDRENWFRVADTAYDGSGSGDMRWTVKACESSQIYFAYFAPYSWERHADLIARCATNPLASGT